MIVRCTSPTTAQYTEQYLEGSLYRFVTCLPGSCASEIRELAEYRTTANYSNPLSFQQMNRFYGMPEN
jgi:hypothetical protein